LLAVGFFALFSSIIKRVKSLLNSQFESISTGSLLSG
jgi:hypothetical protein